MWLSQLRWPALFLASITLAACVSNPPRGERVVIVKPVPSNVVIVPAKYVGCTTVPGRWIYSTWIPEHRVCYYTGGPGNVKRVTWVDGYLICTKYSHRTGHCKHWSRHYAAWYDGVVAY